MVRLLAVILFVGLSSPALSGDLNISQFVFRDLDRNGVYDIGERPLPGVEVLLTQETADPILKTVNLAGFANFKMSDDEAHDITSPGPVGFSVIVPNGFVLTSESPTQRGDIRSLEHAPSGLILDPPNALVGLAPAVTIEMSAEGVERIECVSPLGISQSAQPTQDGASCAAEMSGIWTVKWVSASGEETSRNVGVDLWPVRTARGSADEVGQVTVVESFDTYLTSENIMEVPAANGFVWHNLIAAHNQFYGGWGYVNGTISGEFSGYNSSGHPVTLKSEETFDFHGAFVSVAWPSATEHPVRFKAFRGETLVAEEAFHASNLRPLWFDARWSAIDRLEILHDTYWQVVLDDIALSR